MEDGDRLDRASEAVRKLTNAEGRALLEAFRSKHPGAVDKIAREMGISVAELLAYFYLKGAEAAADGRRSESESHAEQSRRQRRREPMPPMILTPPSLIGAGLLRRLLRPADYKRLIEPHIADMHEEYFACLARGDERGARWAVARGNLYAVPSWLWGLLAQLLARVIDWMRT